MTPENEDEISDWSIDRCMRYLEFNLGIDLNTVELDGDSNDVEAWRNYVAARLDFVVEDED